MTNEVVNGLCALMWARPVGAPLELSFRMARGAAQQEGCFLGAEGLATLCKAMTPTLALLDLEGSNCANLAGDNPEGVLRLCDSLGDMHRSGGPVCFKRNRPHELWALRDHPSWPCRLCALFYL